MTALEALSLGIPLVCPPIGSLERLVAESGAGQVAVSSAPKDLADAVRKVPVETGESHAGRPSLLPDRYAIINGLRSTIALWRDVATGSRL